MHDEIQALTSNNTWSLVPKPADKNIVGSKWVFRIKRTPNGTIEHYKARLVAKGYIQEYGIDYEETFALVAWLTSIRSLLAITAVQKW